MKGVWLPVDGEVIHTQLNIQFKVFPLTKPGTEGEWRDKEGWQCKGYFFNILFQRERPQFQYVGWGGWGESTWWTSHSPRIVWRFRLWKAAKLNHVYNFLWKGNNVESKFSNLAPVKSSWSKVDWLKIKFGVKAENVQERIKIVLKAKKGLGYSQKLCSFILIVKYTVLYVLTCFPSVLKYENVWIKYNFKP